MVRVLLFKDKVVSHGEIHIFTPLHTSFNTGLWSMWEAGCWARWTFDLTWEDPYSDVMKEIGSVCLAGRHLGVQGE